MNRKKPLVRKVALRGNPEKTREWKERSAKRLPVKSARRRTEEAAYRDPRKEFLAKHTRCPVTGKRTTDIHHSAHREGKWLNLRRYWIAVSREGHEWIEQHRTQAEQLDLIVSINPSITYEAHLRFLIEEGLDPDLPVYYELHPEHATNS